MVLPPAKAGNRERLRQSSMIVCQLQRRKRRCPSDSKYDDYCLDGLTVRQVREYGRKHRRPRKHTSSVIRSETSGWLCLYGEAEIAGAEEFARSTGAGSAAVFPVLA